MSLTPAVYTTLMAEEPGSSEQESETLDISSRVREIIEDNDPGSLPRQGRLRDLMREPGIREAPSLKVTLPWYGLPWARWAKGWLEEYNALRSGQKRSITIVCSETERKQAANVFASGVFWVDSEMPAEE